jgi:hypothetical protein
LVCTPNPHSAAVVREPSETGLWALSGLAQDKSSSVPNIS